MWIYIDASGVLGVSLAVVTGFAQRKWEPLVGHAARKGREEGDRGTLGSHVTPMGMGSGNLSPSKACDAFSSS